MKISDEEPFPKKDFLPADISTLIMFTTRTEYIRTVQGRGGPTKDLYKLREWLIEHLGVFYRGFLEQDDSGETSGAIFVSLGKDRVRVPPVHVPFANSQTEYFDVELGGKVYKIKVVIGTLDQVKRDKLIRGNKAKYYYQGNIQTQGVDIRLGKRTIATKQFESIWRSDDGNKPLARHNSYNDFVGEILIPEVPRGILTTVNNKTDFNLDDPNWEKIFSLINHNVRPKRNIREKTEKGLQEKWMSMLKATNPSETVTDERSVWPTGVRIDVYRKTIQGEVIIYELKVGNAQPIHLYQLIMYWDGLELEGEDIKEAILIVEDYNADIEEMITKINTKLKTPNGKTYNLKVERHRDKGL